MDHSGGLGCLRSLPDGPGPHLTVSAGKERDQAEQVKAGVDDAVQALLLEAQFLQKGLLFIRGQFGKLGFDASRDGYDLGSFGRGDVLNLPVERMLLRVSITVVKPSSDKFATYMTGFIVSR